MALAKVELADEAAAGVLTALGTFAPAAGFAAAVVQRHSGALLDVLLVHLTRYSSSPHSGT